MSKSSNPDIIIGGGGIPGLALALLLAKAGVKAALVEPAPLSQFTLKAAEGRTSALMQSSIAVLEKTDVWDACATHGQPLEILRIIDDSVNDKDNMIQSDFCAGDIGLTHFGVNIPNNILRTLLAQKIRQQKNIQLYDQQKISGLALNKTSITVALSQGDFITAQLLVAADGRESFIREKSAIKSHIHDYQQAAITCLISHSRPHENISTEFHRPGGPFTLVPLPGNISSIVWVETSQDADSLTRLRKDDFQRALQERTRGILGRIEIITSPQSCPLIGLRSARLTAPRVALMAEAAHVLSPLGAQGLNLSLRDVSELARIITESLQLGLDTGSQSVLQTYENNRRMDIMIRYAGSDGLTRLVSHKIKPLHEIRRTGLSMISMIEPLRHLAMKQGLSA